MSIVLLMIKLRSLFCIFYAINVTFLGSYEEDLLGTASWEVNGPNRRNSFEDKQGTPIKVRKSPNSRKPAPTKPQSLRRVKIVQKFTYSKFEVLIIVCPKINDCFYNVV